MSSNDGQVPIVVRIVYDGPGSSGKTTNLRTLVAVFAASRRSKLVTPAEEEGETLFFDWLRVDGGRVDGRSLRYLFLSVPGNPRLATRRSQLLGVADVVVFVCDSSPERARWAKRPFDDIRPLAGQLVVQANKQDLPGALSPEEVAAVLESDGDVHHIGATAATGQGVEATAFAAMRLGARRAQQALRRGAFVPTHIHEPNQILAAMHDGTSIDDSPTGAEVEMANSAAVVAKTGSGLPFARTASDRPPSTRKQKKAPRRVRRGTDHQWQHNTVPWTRGRGDEGKPPWPSPDVSSTRIWPGTEARSVLAGLDVESAQWMRGKGDVMVAKVGDWCLRTSADRRYDAEAEARAALMKHARDMKALRHLLPEGSAVVLAARGDEELWLWTLTPWRESLGAWMVRARRDDDAATLLIAVEHFAEAIIDSLRMAVVHEVVLDVHPSNFAVDASRVLYLDGEVTSGRRVPGVVRAVMDVANDLERSPAALEAFLHRLREGLGGFIPADLEMLGLARDLEGERPHSQSAKLARERLREVLDTAGAGA